MVDAIKQETDINNLKGQIKGFDQLEPLLPKNIPSNYIPLLKGYFSAQLYIANGNRPGAIEIFNTILATDDYDKLESENPQLLGAIDWVVRGETAMVDIKKGDKPEFAFNFI